MILTFLIITFAFISRVEAKWWIFGQGNDGVTVNYLYLNKNSYDELGNKVILFKDSLSNGLININGKASVKNGKIGYVKISKDAKQTWEKAKISDNGSFQYSFTPETGQKYPVYIEISDTTGKTNIVDETYKEISVIDENINQIIRETLDNLFKAYENEESNLFMTYVSPDFAGDEAVLDTAIRKDFNAFDYVKIDYFINNISRDPAGKVFLSLHYNRTVVSTKSGQTYADNGNTELIFKNEGGKFKLFSMKNPLMFGLSDAGNVATGTIQSTNNDPIILVNNSGNVDEKPFKEAIDIIEGESDNSDSNISIESVTLDNNDAYAFDSMTKVNPHYFHADISFTVDFMGDTTPRMAPYHGGGSFKPLGACNLYSINSVDPFGSAGYTAGEITDLTVGNCFVIPTGFAGEPHTYTVIKIISVGASSINLQYKYQPNGTNSF
jgi:hypothetical protein